MAPKILILLALVLSGVCTINIPAVCLAQSADRSGINNENQAHKVLTTGQQIETKPVVQIPLKYRRSAIFYSNSRAMYADNMEIIAADERVAMDGSVRSEEDNRVAEEIMAEIARSRSF